jgi:MoaA/NifB/PqqE/SkfB family radical SAM enzyme
MHSDLFRLAARLSTRTTILSTGLLLERFAAQIVGGITDVIVSLDGPPAIHNEIRRVPEAFERLAAGVRAIHALAPGFPISARCTVQAMNAAHLRATVIAARELGLRSISFLAADLTSTAFNRPTSWAPEKQASIAPDRSVLQREMEALIAEYPQDGFILETPAKLRRIVTPNGAPRCNAPWVSAVIEPNGDVRPCFFHPPIGNTANGTLAEIINGPQAIAFRDALVVAENPVCQRCVCSLYVT